MYPDSSPRLRQIIRRALKICQDTFHRDVSLLIILCQKVTEILGVQYNEMTKNSYRNPVILEAFQEHFDEKEAEAKRTFPRLVEYYPKAKDIDPIDATILLAGLQHYDKTVKDQSDELSFDMALKLHKEFGFSVDQLHILANIKDMKFNEDEFRVLLAMDKENLKLGNKIKHQNLLENLPETDSSFVHMYSCSRPSNYLFPLVNAKICAIGGEQDLNVQVIYF